MSLQFYKGEEKGIQSNLSFLQQEITSPTNTMKLNFILNVEHFLLLSEPRVRCQHVLPLHTSHTHSTVVFLGSETDTQKSQQKIMSLGDGKA